MCTGGGILLLGRCCGSITLAPPESPWNQIFPSEDQITWEPARNAMGAFGTPSELSKTVGRIFRRESVAHASNSLRTMRTRPHVMLSQNERFTSCVIQ